MKKILPFIKSRWMIIILGVIALAALPALWFVSNGMAAKTRETFQKRVETDYRDVTASKVAYKLVSPTGESILEKSEEANAARIQGYKAIGEQLQAQTSVVSKAADDLNTNEGKHKLLIEGLFPAPADVDLFIKPKDFARTQQSRRAELGEFTRDTMVPISVGPDDISIIVAGGAGTHSVYFPVSGRTCSVTREVVLRG